MPYRIGNLRAPVDVSNPIRSRLFPRLHWFLFSCSLGKYTYIYVVYVPASIYSEILFERSADSTKEDLACAEKTLSLCVIEVRLCAPSNGSSSVGNIKEINQVRGHFSSHHRPGRVSETYTVSLLLSLAEKFPLHLTSISE